jgi:ubiquinone/menaquinone biosynthesis C-methylase UbiE
VPRGVPYKDMFISPRDPGFAAAAQRLAPAALVAALAAAGEPTRLRALALLREGELAVGELAAALDQSQPRVSRHLKLLTESGLTERAPEGAWVFCRLPQTGTPMRTLADALLDMVDLTEATFALDKERLNVIRAERETQANAYFERVAPQWNEIRSLHLPEAAIEAGMLAAAGSRPFERHVDIGVGTGRMIALFAPQCVNATGIDSSREMLAVARGELKGLVGASVELRSGDAYRLPVATGAADLVTLHQVLHFLVDPASALAEAVRILAPGGVLLIADFAPHAHEYLREQHAHRRLGFAAGEVSAWAQAAGATVTDIATLPPERSGLEGLTVQIWRAERVRAEDRERAMG